MKMKRNRTIPIVLLVLVLSMTTYGCSRNNSVDATAEPAVATTPTNPAESAISPKTEIVSEHQAGDRYEGTVTIDGVEQTVQYEQNQESASGLFTGVMGTEFTVPEGFTQLDESPSIGYQYTFWHQEYEIRIVVYEIAPGDIPEEAYETDYNIAKNNPDVTYFNQGENWFAQSGYNNNGEEIFYSKESSTDSGLKSFWITYPTAKREFGDLITADFEANCSF